VYLNRSIERVVIRSTKIHTQLGQGMHFYEAAIRTYRYGDIQTSRRHLALAATHMKQRKSHHFLIRNIFHIMYQQIHIFASAAQAGHVNASLLKVVNELVLFEIHNASARSVVKSGCAKAQPLFLELIAASTIHVATTVVRTLTCRCRRRAALGTPTGN
jgi:hypothetical protein